MTEWSAWIQLAVSVAVSLAAAAVLTLVLRTVIRIISKRIAWLADVDRRLRTAWLVTVSVVALWVGCAVSQMGQQEWWTSVSRLFLAATILSGAWILAVGISVGGEWLLTREAKLNTGAELRRRRTQVLFVQRLVIVAIGVIAVGAALATFPVLRVVGTSLLASAGIVSVIAGLAAQSIFGNLIAGIQIAFTDAIRVGDVVVVEDEWGRIGEINLSYVVVNIWDERRLVVPCSYFTSNPIETWTRKSDRILGVVNFDVDWRVPVATVREKFTQIVTASPHWDQRSSSLAVTNVAGGTVTIRCVMSAKNSDDQGALCNEVREQLVAWLQSEHPEALPLTRVVVEDRRAGE